ncbi:hypothetical protein ACIGFK_07500 [Streptomyces sp. NPDC085524]|uniref:hypothetical protein n=1 Tax=unclassified Streptomyces TaxID=2593676 RepID=UPI0035D599E7
MTTDSTGSHTAAQGGPEGSDPGVDQERHGEPGAPAGQDPAGTAPKPTAPASGTGPAAQDTADTIARLVADLAAARAEAGKTRVTAKQKAADEARAELAQQIGRALGLVEADTPPDPDLLTRQLTDERARARQTAVELAVYRTAREAGGDPEALLDSRAFSSSLAGIDPADTAAVRAAIEAAVAVNSKLAAQPPAGPTRGGAEFTHQPQGITPAHFAAMSYGQRVQLHRSDPDTYRRLAGTS